MTTPSHAPVTPAVPQNMPSTRSDAATALLVLPAAVLLLGPFAMLAHAATRRPEVLDMLLAKPITAVLLAGGFLTSLLLCGLPFVLRASRATSSAARGVSPTQTSTSPARPATAAGDCHGLAA